jgi:hypothetical protein
VNKESLFRSLNGLIKKIHKKVGMEVCLTLIDTGTTSNGSKTIGNSECITTEGVSQRYKKSVSFSIFLYFVRFSFLPPSPLCNFQKILVNIVTSNSRKLHYTYTSSGKTHKSRSSNNVVIHDFVGGEGA